MARRIPFAISFDVSSSGVWQPKSWLNSRTTLGSQYVNYAYDEAEAPATS